MTRGWRGEVVGSELECGSAASVRKSHHHSTLSPSLGTIKAAPYPVTHPTELPLLRGSTRMYSVTEGAREIHRNVPREHDDDRAAEESRSSRSPCVSSTAAAHDDTRRGGDDGDESHAKQSKTSLRLAGRDPTCSVLSTHSDTNGPSPQSSAHRSVSYL